MKYVGLFLLGFGVVAAVLIYCVLILAITEPINWPGVLQLVLFVGPIAGAITIAFEIETEA